MTGSEFRAVSVRLCVAGFLLGLSACAGTGDFRTAGGGAASAERVASTGKALATGLRRAPNDPGSALRMAETALGGGKLKRAAQLFELAEHNARRPVARSLQGRGLIALRSGQPELALRLFNQALERDPDLWRAKIGTARAHLALGDPAGATQALIRAEASAALNASALNDIGMVFLTDQVPDRAVAYFERALVLEAQHPSARSNIRIARAMLGDYDAAVAGVAPDDAADALNNAGYAAILNGAYETADRLLRRALEISPVYHAAARANLELLNQATAGTLVRRRAPKSGRDLVQAIGPAIARAEARKGGGAAPATRAAPAVSDADVASEPAPTGTYQWAHKPASSVSPDSTAPAVSEDEHSTPTIGDGGYRWIDQPQSS